MTLTTLAALLHAGLIGFACAFQLALMAGAPWGSLSMGGRFPGKLPTGMRLVCVIQIAMLVSIGLIVLSRAGLALPEWRGFAQRGVWAAVVISGLSAVANLATPSRWERILWAPVGVLLFATSLYVALN